jgi:hypothetical protein
MHEWFSLEWWRYAWGPALAAGLVWLASTWKTTSDTRGARDARLDSRQEKELARLDAENEELREERDTIREQALGAIQFAHDQRHEWVRSVSSFTALRSMVGAYLRGTLSRDRMQQAYDADEVPRTPPHVPPLHEMAGRRSD